MARGNVTLDRRITAYHEAAHAVVAFRFGISIGEVALCHAGPLAGYVTVRHDPLLSNVIRSSARATQLTWTLVARDTEHRAMVLLAGAIAEAKLLKTKLRSHQCVSDLSRCHLLCTELYGYGRHLVATQAMNIPEEKPADMANRLRRQTLQILAHRNTWRAVTALADDLEGWSRLTGHEAADTVQWTRRIRKQLGLYLPMPRKTNRTEENGVRADEVAIGEQPGKKNRVVSNGKIGGSSVVYQTK